MPADPDAGVPASTPAVVRVTPAGNAPVAANVGAGVPVAVTLNVPAVATVKVVVAALVKDTAPVARFSVNEGSAAPEFAELPQLATP